MLVLRLQPGQDLKAELVECVRQNQLQAAWISTCVGSLRGLRLRLANRNQVSEFDGYQEIVSFTGTLSPADQEGVTRGGHLVEGNLVYTTAEIVILEAPGLRFQRLPDEQTGSNELRVTPRQ